MYKAGHDVADLTTTRYYKIDPKTDLLIRRKVRHSWDEKRVKNNAAKKSPEALEKVEMYCRHTMPIGEIEANMLIAMAADPSKYMVARAKIDLSMGDQPGDHGSGSPPVAPLPAVQPGSGAPMFPKMVLKTLY